VAADRARHDLCVEWGVWPKTAQEPALSPCTDPARAATLAGTTTTKGTNEPGSLTLDALGAPLRQPVGQHGVGSDRVRRGELAESGSPTPVFTPSHDECRLAFDSSGHLWESSTAKTLTESTKPQFVYPTKPCGVTQTLRNLKNRRTTEKRR
jgi:hypothetical protein